MAVATEAVDIGTLLKENAALLEEILQYPPGDDVRACLDSSVPPDERPVWGQEHRVVIAEFPPAGQGPGRRFIRYLKELQEEYEQHKHRLAQLEEEYFSREE